MSNCNSNPTSGCTENLLAIQLKIKKNEADPLFVDIEGVLDDILAKLVSCCSETGTNLDSMYEKLAQVLAINTECCEDINEKLELIAQELCILSENIEPCDETPGTSTTTPEQPAEGSTTSSTSTTTPEPVPTTSSSTPEPCYFITANISQTDIDDATGNTPDMLHPYWMDNVVYVSYINCEGEEVYYAYNTAGVHDTDLCAMADSQNYCFYFKNNTIKILPEITSTSSLTAIQCN